MLIRSQDKRILFDISGTTIKATNENKIIGYGNNQPAEACEILGEYSTEENAIKVLDMIQDMYLSRLKLDGGFDHVNGCYIQPNFWILPRVFQMPSGGEVEV